MTLRRLFVLLRGLPPDAAVWRRDALPPGEEFLALLVERLDGWGRALLDAQLGAQQVNVPGPIHLVRPGAPEPEPEPSPVETDPNRIAAFFGLA